MRNVVLGVSGSVAAYRAADIARDLMRAGCTVRVCLTDAAQKFVSAALFEALTGEPCLVDAFQEPETGRMAHIDWARQADVLLIAPATANTINKLASGIADDMLTTIALVYEGPLVVAPAMNPAMLDHETTRASLARLRSWATTVVEPAEGDVACGEHGQGKLADTAAIVAATLLAATRSQILTGRKVLITSGPTREPIDCVRFVSNRSSGKMGAALARAALLMGAEVTVVSGPTTEPLPRHATIVRVETAEQMLAAAKEFAGNADMVIGAAAIADYRPEQVHDGKLRRVDERFDLRMVKSPDVLAELASLTRGIAVGFAAEPSTDPASALAKLQAKGLAAIAINDVSRSDIGFDAVDNDLTLILADGTRHTSGKLSKFGCALWLLEQCLPLLKS